MVQRLQCRKCKKRQDIAGCFDNAPAMFRVLGWNTKEQLCAECNKSGVVREGNLRNLISAAQDVLAAACKENQ